MRPHIPVFFVLTLTAGLLVAATPAPEAFVFERLNRVYESEADQMAPIVQGPVTIRLSSPENAVTVQEHRLELVPLPDGTHRARLDVALAGRGFLVADVEVAGLASRFEDEVTLPAQRRILEGRIEMARGEGGFLITPLELPRQMRLDIESRLAGRFVELCNQLSLLPGMAAGCDGLERSLATAAVPLPPPGETYLLPDAALTGKDRRQLLRYLEGAASAR